MTYAEADETEGGGGWWEAMPNAAPSPLDADAASTSLRMAKSSFTDLAETVRP